MHFSKYLIFSFFLACLLMIGCTSNSSSTNEAKNNEEEEEHHDEAQTITELTTEQIKSVGIEFGTMEMRSIVNSEKVNGKLKVPNSDVAVVTAVFSGVIQVVKIHEGDYVRKGQVIAVISNPEYIDVQEQYLLIRNQITYAEQEFERQQELFDNGAGAKKNLQTATTQLKELRTKQASLRKKLQMMGINADAISDSNIRNGLTIVAPISGTVSILTAKVGSFIDVASPVAEIINNEAIHLDLYVFEKNIAGIDLGQTVDFTLTNKPNVSYKAKVSSIGSSFENESKTILVHCTIEGNKTGLIDGMTVVGSLHLTADLTTAVPTSAIVDDAGKSYIFVKTDKMLEDHGHSHADEDGHDHSDGDGHDHANEASESLRFEKIEVAKGASDLGYTAIVPVIDLPKETKIVIKGSFFVNAKMSNTGGHEH